jgi:protoporphyrin/coproporphyrin ferrochelatase
MSDARCAVMLMGYGTPRTPADILPFYTDIRRGNPPTCDQLEELTARYAAIGGTSPLAQRSEGQRHAMQVALDRVVPGKYRVVLGMKHASPFVEEAVDELATQGFRRVVGLVLAPHYSAFSVGQYLDRLAAAAAPHEMQVCEIRSWATDPAFVDFVAADLRAKLATMPGRTRVLFTAHSLPDRIRATDDPYPSELRATAECVATVVGLDNWGIAWQSAGRTPEPWLGPDILQVIDQLARDGDTNGVLVSAVGFVADHLEVLYDLDIEASGRASARGLAFARTACVNDDATVMAALAERVVRAAGES